MGDGEGMHAESLSLRHALCLLALLVPIAVIAAAQQPAEVIVMRARVYTVNPKQKWAEAVAVRGGKIVAVGSEHDVGAYRGPATKQIDAAGRLVLPAFTDCHVHFIDGSMSLQRIHLDDAKDLTEILRRVKAYADTNKDQAWVLGRGWTYPAVGPNLVDKKDLDRIVPDRPVYLEAFDGHTWWANSRALQLAGITRDTPNPPGGEIVRDPKTGEPTGALKEDAADLLIKKVIPAPSRDERLKAIRAGMHEANRYGVVRVHSASGVSVGTDDFQDLALYDELRKKGELTIRMYAAYRAVPPAFSQAQIEEVERARERYHDEWVAAGAVKFFLDGVVETHTAAMLAPYSDDTSLSGSLLWDPEAYKRTVAELDKHGLQIFTHAIGDRAVRLALDAYQEAAETNYTRDARHRIEHIETISAADISRFGKLGVIASMQPLHAYPDEDTLDVWARNVGPERAQRAWAWRSIEQVGGAVAFGSDWPIVTINPWPGVAVAVTRQTEEGNPPEGFVPQQRLSVEQAIRGYTLGAAFAGHREKTEGSIEPGKVADLIVLSQDLFKIEPSEIPKTKILLTMVGGKVVYQAPGWAAAKSAAEKN